MCSLRFIGSLTYDSLNITDQSSAHKAIDLELSMTKFCKQRVMQWEQENLVYLKKSKKIYLDRKFAEELV